MSAPLIRIEPRSFERSRVPRVVQALCHLRVTYAGELPHEVHPPAADGLGEFGYVIGEVEEGPGRSVFLTLEEHGRGRRQKEYGGHRPVSCRTRPLPKPRTRRRVRDLVVVLEIGDQR